MEPQILRLPAVLEATGICRSLVYKLVAQGSFPTPVRLGSRAVGWRRSDIEEWLDGLEEATSR